MKAFQGHVSQALGVAFMVLILPTYAQIPSTQIPGAQIPNTPCTASMISSFTPCMSYLTNSSGTAGTSPTYECCTSLSSLLSNGTQCLCQIIMAGVPFRIPNRSLAISLPKACNQAGVAGVPIQCKASPSSPIPAPGPAAFGPSASPAASTIPTSDTPALAPVPETTPALTPPSTQDSLPPTSTTTGTGSSPTPSAAMPSLSVSPSLLLFSVAIMIMKYF